MRKNKKDKKQDINYLDLIPETNQSIRWHRDLKQRIILEIENKGMFNTIAQKVFGKPRFSKVHLDEMGTFIWASSCTVLAPSISGQIKVPISSR